jgi:hypothetical protein
MTNEELLTAKLCALFEIEMFEASALVVGLQGLHRRYVGLEIISSDEFRDALNAAARLWHDGHADHEPRTIPPSLHVLVLLRRELDRCCEKKTKEVEAMTAERLADEEQDIETGEFIEQSPMTEDDSPIAVGDEVIVRSHHAFGKVSAIFPGIELSYEVEVYGVARPLMIPLRDCAQVKV